MATMDEKMARLAIEWNLRRSAAILGKSDEGLDKLAADIAKAKTAPVRPDRRFPNTNQAANCWTAVNEFMLCVEKRGREDPSCVQRGRDYGSMCPQKWVENWKEQQEKGIGMTVGKEFFGTA